MHKALFVIGILLLVPFTVPVAPAQTTKAPYQLEWWLYNTGNETIDGYKIINSTDGRQINASVSNVYSNYSFVSTTNTTTDVTNHDQWLYDVQTGFVVGLDKEFWVYNGTMFYGFARYRTDLLKLQVNSTIEVRGLGWYSINGSAPALFAKDNVTQRITDVWQGNITISNKTVPVTYFDSITVNSTSTILNVTNPGPEYGYWGAVSNVTHRPVILGYGPWSQSNFSLSTMSFEQSPIIIPITSNRSYKRLIDFQVDTTPQTTMIDTSTVTSANHNEITTSNTTPIFYSFIFVALLIIAITKKRHTD